MDVAGFVTILQPLGLLYHPKNSARHPSVGGPRPACLREPQVAPLGAWCRSATWMCAPSKASTPPMAPVTTREQVHLTRHARQLMAGPRRWARGGVRDARVGAYCG